MFPFFPSALEPALAVWPAPFPRPDSSHCSQMMAVCRPMQKKKNKICGLNSVSLTQLVLQRKETSRHPPEELSVGLAACSSSEPGWRWPLQVRGWDWVAGAQGCSAGLPVWPYRLAPHGRGMRVFLLAPHPVPAPVPPQAPGSPAGRSAVVLPAQEGTDLQKAATLGNISEAPFSS